MLKGLLISPFLLTANPPTGRAGVGVRVGGDVVVSAHAALGPASKSTVSFQRPALRFVGPRLGVLGSSLLRVAKPGEDKGLGSVASWTALGSVAGQRGLQSAGPSWGHQCWCLVPIRHDLTTQRRRTDMLPPLGPALNLRARGASTESAYTGQGAEVGILEETGTGFCAADGWWGGGSWTVPWGEGAEAQPRVASPRHSRRCFAVESSSN